jgi:prolyl 4-hydroxylase
MTIYCSKALKLDRNPLFKSSGVVDDQGFKKPSENRTSSTAYLPPNDAIVQRIAARAAEFQGFTSYNTPDLQLTRYYRGQQYKPHVDWYNQFETIINKGNRITTFFVILESSCTQCGTRFPNLRLDCDGNDSRLNETIDCEDVEGITVRPVPGSATFWRNLGADGIGDGRTLHAGLPPEDGVKIGLNIWTSVKTDIFGRIHPGEWTSNMDTLPVDVGIITYELQLGIMILHISLLTTSIYVSSIFAASTADITTILPIICSQHCFNPYQL